MPSSNFHDPKAFRIVLDNPQGFYAGGDVLSGTVILDAAEEQSIGEVCINVIGRAKTKIVRNNGQSRLTYRGRALLFDVPLHLHRGKYTYKAGTYTWLFSLPIPMRAQPTLLSGDQWHSEDGYLSSQDQLSASSLPPTYQCDFSFHTSNEAFVEYKLLAQLTEAEDASRFLPRRTYTAEYPLHLSAPATDYSITDLPFRTTPNKIVMRTLKLLPEHADPSQKLSFRQKTHSFFHRSQLPALNFVLHITLPQVIQLDHTNEIPLLVSAELVSFDLPSDDSSQSSATDQGLETKALSGLRSAAPLPQITLAKFSLKIATRTRYRSKSQGFFNYSPSECHTEDVKIAEKMTCNLPIPLLTTESGPSSGKECVPAYETSQPRRAPDTPLDLGSVFPFYFKHKTPKRCYANSRSDVLLYPSFRTCNIQHSHAWKLKLWIECAGETETVERLGLPLEVLGRARFGGSDQVQGLPQAQMAPMMTDAWEVGSAHGTGNLVGPPMYRA